MRSKREVKVTGSEGFCCFLEAADTHSLLQLFEQKDQKSHHIPEGSYFDWQPDKTPLMYGWKVAFAQALVEPQLGPHTKGMIGCKAITRVAVLEKK